MTKRYFIILSICLNFLLLSIFGKIIVDRGGLRYLANRFSQAKAAQAQGFSKKKNAPNTDRQDMFGVLPKTTGDIVFIGDSLTRPCEWVELFGDIRVKNRGLGGDTTKEMLLRLDNILSSQPDKIFIMVGINDLKSRTPIDTIVENYKRIIETIRAESPTTEVYIQSVLPVTNERETTGPNNESIIELNNRLNVLTSQYNLTYVDLFSLVARGNNKLDPVYSTDGLHLNGQGYLVWKNAIQEYVHRPQ